MYVLSVSYVYCRLRVVCPLTDVYVAPNSWRFIIPHMFGEALKTADRFAFELGILSVGRKMNAKPAG